MKILFATDGSDFSAEAAKKMVGMIALGEGTRIRILSVAKNVFPVGADPFGGTNDFYVQEQNRANDLAEETVKNAESFIRENAPNSVEIEVKSVSGHPREVIVEEAKEWGADLIVVGSHGRGFWGRMLIGSVSDAVVHHAPCSVLIVRK